MPGRVVTFYSYKGGVGRSFALANIAVILAQWGCRILVVDWDIEAPGLNHYFSPYLAPSSAGVIDFLTDCRRGRAGPWDHYAKRADIPQSSGSLHIMTASAAGGSDYTALVQQLDWDALYQVHALGERLESLRAQWVAEFDLVLVDSRTGVTDFSGLTTAQLPDILAFMFTANEQSLVGCSDIAQRAMDARRRMPLDRPALLPLPIVARFEQREEYDRAQVWRKRFVTELAPFFAPWAPSTVDPLRLIDLLTIPYVPRWTFGEELACLVEPAGSSGTRSPSQTATYACETIAALLLQGFAKVDLLVSSRDEYVHGARLLAQSRRAEPEAERRIFLSYSHSDSEAVAMLRPIADALTDASSEGTEVSWTSGAQPNFPAVAERSNAYLILIGPSFLEAAVHQRETEWLLRQSLRNDDPVPVIPLVLKGAESAFFASRLADHNAVFVDPTVPLETQLQPVFARLNRPRAVK